MPKPKLRRDFVTRCRAVTAKRPKTVIDHIPEYVKEIIRDRLD